MIRAILSSMKFDWNYKRFWTSPLKHLSYRIQWELRPHFKIAGKVPLAVDIETTSRCNFRCTMCQKTSKWWTEDPKREETMTLEHAKAVIDQCAKLGVYSMKFNWRGEPTINRDLCKMIRYAKDKRIHECTINTNASLLTPKLCHELIESGLDRIIFSCDGISKETYDKIRVNGNFDVFESNVRMFRNIRNVLDADRPWSKRRLPSIRLNMAVMDQNRHEVPLVRKYFDGVFDEFRFNSVYQPQSAESLNKGQHRTTKRKGCPQIYQRLIVSGNGDVSPCCVNYRKINMFRKATVAGLDNIFQKDSGRLRVIHEKHKGRTLDLCKSCDNFSLSEIDDKGKVIYK